MFMIPIQMSTSECVDCIEKGLNKDWTGFVTCVGTIIVGVVIRAIEKNKIKRNLKKK